MCQKPDVSLELDHLVNLTGVLMDMIHENALPPMESGAGNDMLMTLHSRINNQFGWLSHDVHFLADDIYRRLYPPEGKS